MPQTRPMPEQTDWCHELRGQNYTLHKGLLTCPQRDNPVQTWHAWSCSGDFAKVKTGILAIPKLSYVYGKAWKGHEHVGPMEKGTEVYSRPSIGKGQLANTMPGTSDTCWPRASWHAHSPANNEHS